MTDQDKSLLFSANKSVAASSTNQSTLIGRGLKFLTTNTKSLEWLIEQGDLYQHGIDVEKSYEKAIYYYSIAADRGSSEGERRLGYMYANGYGVIQSSEQALYWWLKAADKNDAKAQFNIGNSYNDGKGVNLSLSFQ